MLIATDDYIGPQEVTSGVVLLKCKQAGVGTSHAMPFNQDQERIGKGDGDENGRDG